MMTNRLRQKFKIFSLRFLASLALWRFNLYFLGGHPMLKPLPQFHKRSFTYVHRFAARVLTNERQAETTRLVQLVTYLDGHYRAIFKPDYFALPEGQTEPSKSQW